MTTGTSAERIFCGELLRGEARPSESGLTADDFLEADCRAVFEATSSLEQRGQEVSLVSVAELLPSFTEALVALAQLSGAAFGADCRQHAEIIRKAAQRRRLAEIGKVLEDAASSGGEPTQIADAAWNALTEVLSSDRQLETTNLVAAIEAVLARRDHPPEKSVVVPSGLPKLDALLNGGFRAGDLVIIGARPAVGKSALLLSFVIHAASTGRRVLYVSLEMTAQQNAERYLAATSGLPVSWFVNDLRLNEAQLRAVADGQRGQNPALIEEYDATLCTVSDIRQLARRMRATGGLDLIAVDYLGLLSAAGRGANRNDEVANISRGLKALAMELSVPVIAAHQLNRGNDKEERKPRLSDLRDSGAVEQDAGVVLLLHHEQDKQTGDSDKRRILVRLAKNRQGATGVIALDMIARLMRFEEVDS